MEARERLAHFFCELRDSLGSMSAMKENSDGLPIAQEELGYAFRMSTFHVNRVVQGMRADGLISTRGKTLIVNDWQRLQQAGPYNLDDRHINQQVGRD